MKFSNETRKQTKKRKIVSKIERSLPIWKKSRYAIIKTRKERGQEEWKKERFP
jgi:hypothetical protein